MPIKVEQLKYVLYNETTACVSWGPPIFKSGNVIYYSLSYTPDQNWPLETWYNMTTKRNSQVSSFETNSQLDHLVLIWNCLRVNLFSFFSRARKRIVNQFLYFYMVWIHVPIIH